MIAGSLPDIAVELLVVPVWESDDLADLEGLDAAVGGEIARARERGEFRGKPFEQFIATTVHPGWRARRVMLVGAGPRDTDRLDRLRQLASAASMTARQRRIGGLGFALRSSTDPVAGAQAVAEGLTLGEFDPGRYKTEADTSPLELLLVVVAPERGGDVAGAVVRGRLMGECSNLARTLANEPGNELTPRAFAQRALDITGSTSLRVEVLDEAAIKAVNLGLLLGVARGSAEPPRLIVLHHEPEGVAPKPVLGLVGKGITFDSGGISLKPPDGMERMKDDMAGGAAVICAMRAISVLNVPIRVVGVVPATENMPGGHAVKPGDVLMGASGKSVEVVNTDAEGRLVLADALWYAQQQGATHLVDVATLTGGCIVALGKITTGLFGTPESWVDVVRRNGDRAGDRAWPMPVFDEYADQLRSEIADLSNTGGRPASAITAAVFLKEFTGGLPWAHLDIAGTAWSDEARPYQPKGPTGVAVRTLVELACDSDAWRNLG